MMTYLAWVPNKCEFKNQKFKFHNKITYPFNIRHTNQISICLGGIGYESPYIINTKVHSLQKKQKNISNFSKKEIKKFLGCKQFWFLLKS